MEDAPVVKRGRGRPPKGNAVPKVPKVAKVLAPGEKRGRGRPPKGSGPAKKAAPAAPRAPARMRASNNHELIAEEREVQEVKQTGEPKRGRGRPPKAQK